MRAADRLRLQVQSGEPGYLYACRLDFDGAVTHLPDAADPTPIRLETRQSLALPVDPAASFVLFQPLFRIEGYSASPDSFAGVEIGGLFVTTDDLLA